jgi:excisionase family DNA binding protein
MKRPTIGNEFSNGTDLMNIREASKFLRLAPGTLYAWTERRKIPFIRLGSSRIRFRRADLEKFIADSIVAADGVK